MITGRGWNRQVSGLSLRRPPPIDSRKNLVFFGKTKLFQFGENEAAIYAHFEGPTAPLNQLGFNPVLIFDRILQTCSIWKVESLSTIFNRDIHRAHSLLANWGNIHHRMGTRYSSHFPPGRQATRASSGAKYCVRLITPPVWRGAPWLPRLVYRVWNPLRIYCTRY